MAIANYTDLKAAVIARTGRTDISDANAAEYIALAEGELNIALRNLRRMKSKTTLSIAASNTSVTLPSDFMALVLVKHQTVPTFMQHTTLSEMDNSYVGRPYYYEVLDKFYFAPTADSAYTLDFIYTQTLPPLASNATNWLLTQYPHIYLNAAMYQAFKAKRNVEEATNYLSLQDRDVQQIIAQDMLGSYQMRPATQP